MPRPIIVCPDCGQTRPHSARGLCNSCHRRNSRHGTLTDWPATLGQQPTSEIVEDYTFMTSTGVTRAEAAARLGMSQRTLERHLARARDEGEAG